MSDLRIPPKQKRAGSFKKLILITIFVLTVIKISITAANIATIMVLIRMLSFFSFYVYHYRY